MYLKLIRELEEDNAFVRERFDIRRFLADTFAFSYLHEVNVLYKKSPMTILIVVSVFFFVHVFYKMTLAIDVIFT